MKKQIVQLCAAALLLASCVTTVVAAESKPEARQKAGPAEVEKQVSLSKPYPSSYSGAPTDRISVQYAVIELGRQAGLHYDWDASARNTEGLCRKWIYPDVNKQLFKTAMKKILNPLGLGYEIRDGNTIVLTKP